DFAGAHHSHPSTVRASHLRVPDGDHLRAVVIVVSEGTGLRLITCSCGVLCTVSSVFVTDFVHLLRLLLLLIWAQNMSGFILYTNTRSKDRHAVSIQVGVDANA